MKKILITNDDGVFADGIIRLAEASKEFGEVWVVATEDQRSAASHSITLRGSFRGGVSEDTYHRLFRGR